MAEGGGQHSSLAANEAFPLGAILQPRLIHTAAPRR